MKLTLFTLGILAAASTFAAPPLPADQAVALANKHLKERGASADIYLTSLKFEPTDVRRSQFRWSVDWSQPIPLDESKKEVGIEIAMDGSIVSLVKGPVKPRIR